jgi:hypothetical protein
MTFSRILAVLCVAIVTLSYAVLAQNDVEDFPLGTTKMVYELITDETAESQTIELTVIGYEDGRYRMSLHTESVGLPEQLTVFGFLFQAAAVETGTSHVSYSPLQALMDRRDKLEAGQDYIVGAEATFADVELVEIASVHCLQGVLVDEATPEERMTVAFALTFPVFVPPRIVVEELQEDGSWHETFSLQLTEYSRVQSEG